MNYGLAGVLVGAFVVLAILGFYLLLRSLREFSSSVSGLTSILKPLLANPDLLAVVNAFPSFVQELRSISKGVDAMTAALKVFNAAVLSREAAPTPSEGPEAAGVYPYAEEEAASSEEKLRRMLFKQAGQE